MRYQHNCLGQCRCKVEMCKKFVPEIEGILEKEKRRNGSERGAGKTAVTDCQLNPGRKRERKETIWIRMLGRGLPFLSTPKSSCPSSARGREDLRRPRVQS